MKSFKKTAMLLGAAAVAASLAACKPESQDQSSNSQSAVPLTRDEAQKSLTEKVSQIRWRNVSVGQVSADPTEVAEQSGPKLPPLDTFPLTVNPRAGQGETVIEIFTSTEKSGSGMDGWMVEVGNAFNRTNTRLADGTTARVAIRKVASGTGYEFVGYGLAQPDAFSPSNELWGNMATARGAKLTEVAPRLVGNVPGVVMKEEKARQIESERGHLNITDVVDDVIQGKLIAGYTDPFSSSTGLNFLVSVLDTFAGGDESKMLSPDVTAAFEQFQKGVPFVAQTTMQMRDSVANDGSLDTFVMERQTFVNTDSLRSGYRFIPFGVRHDNPLYAVGNLPEAKMEALKDFAAFATGQEMQALAQRYGFNRDDDYKATFPAPGGQTLIDAQRVWKQKKDGGRKIAAVFLVDTSGSMDGTRMKRVKEALREGAKAISADNSIGLVSFSDDVRVNVPIRPFKVLQKSTFLTAVDQLTPTGGTAMYDGIAVSLSLLQDQIKADPNVKPVLFVLTDGETNQGLSFRQMADTIRGLGIPVHTVGFEADIKELGRLSSLVEAASMNASEADVSYRISAMLNSQM